MNRKEEMELLPCPFCGGKVKVCVGENNFVDACVSCDACSASGPIFDNDPETGGFSTDPEGDAIKHWNTRTALRASAAPEERGKKVWDEGEHEGCGIESERAFKREQIDAELARTLTDGAAYVQQIRSTVIEECARVAENYGEAGSGSRNQKRRSGIANAIRALPSDSGKAAPDRRDARAEDIAMTLCIVDGHDPDSEAPLTEMCTDDNQPVPWWMVYVEYAEALIEKFKVTDLAALAPATEGGGREIVEPDALSEGMEILVNLTESIRKHGNYTPETTLTFIDQALQALREATAGKPTQDVALPSAQSKIEAE